MPCASASSSSMYRPSRPGRSAPRSAERESGPTCGARSPETPSRPTRRATAVSWSWAGRCPPARTTGSPPGERRSPSSGTPWRAPSRRRRVVRRGPPSTPGPPLARRHLRSSPRRSPVGAQRALPEPGLPGAGYGVGIAVPPGGHGGRGTGASRGLPRRRRLRTRRCGRDEGGDLHGARRRARLDLATVTRIFLNRELWQRPLPLRQLDRRLPSWSSTRPSHR